MHLCYSYEKFLLLCIHEDKGTFIRSTIERMRPGVVGTILAELATYPHPAGIEDIFFIIQEATKGDGSFLDMVAKP
jgi:hypothetical protein